MEQITTYNKIFNKKTLTMKWLYSKINYIKYVTDKLQKCIRISLISNSQLCYNNPNLKLNCGFEIVLRSRPLKIEVKIE